MSFLAAHIALVVMMPTGCHFYQIAGECRTMCLCARKDRGRAEDGR
jgi:hypothetical protein